MARTTDLGWCIARCDSDELTLVEPESEDCAAKSITVQGFENILALRDLLDEVIADRGMQTDIAEGS